MNKATKKTTKKSDRKSITSKTKNQMDTVLARMEPGKWYRSSDFMEFLDVKETRTKELLRIMVELGMLIDDGSTKGKRYQIKEQ